MAETSNIEWCDGTFNPWIGCSKVGLPGCETGCKNCYAERDFDHRKGRVKWGPAGTRSMTSASNWNAVINMGRKFYKEHGRRMRLFCASLADVYESFDGQVVNHKGEPLWAMAQGITRFANSLDHISTEAMVGYNPIRLETLRRWLFYLIDATPEIEWLLLTKRPENIVEMTPGLGKVRSNVRFGTSIEHQQAADLRLPELVFRASTLSSLLPFVSAEPLLGGVTLKRWLADIGWVITGGESGPKARPGKAAWYRQLRDECDATGTPFLFKQWGEWLNGPIVNDESYAGGQYVEAMGKTSVLSNTVRILGLDVVYGTGQTFVTEAAVRVGKKAAGRLLDGVEHNGYPLS